jgi:ribosomal protein S13
MVVALKTDSELFRVLTQLQDEVHRFAITFHREKRSKRALHSELDDIKGIGPKTKEELLKKLNFDELSYEEKDAIYRAVWLNHVKNDVKAFIKDQDIALNEDQIDHIAQLYVYDGRYDCNLNYWDNLDNLINEEFPS